MAKKLISKQEKPQESFLDEDQVLAGVKALKNYIKKSRKQDSKKNKKDLLEAGLANPDERLKVIAEVVFKNIPSNSRTYIHNVVLPNHWRLQLPPEELNLAVFVRHRKPETEAQKIQFSRDRDLDIENTHSYYQRLFEEKLDDSIRSRISRIITTKELATEFNTFQKLDRLSKTYDMFLADKILMANKLNPLPRRLGRRFWVREKKVPIMVKLNSENMDERFGRALKIEPFYVLGKAATERCQLGLISQSNSDLAENFQAFLKKLYDNYGECVRYIRLRTNWGLALTLYADLSSVCPRVVIRKRREKRKPVIDDFDMLDGEAKVSVHSDGTVNVIRPIKRKRKSSSGLKAASSSSPPISEEKEETEEVEELERPVKKIRRLKQAVRKSSA